MKTSVYKEVEFLSQWVSYGYSFKRVAYGFSIDKYSLQIDLLFFWFGVEFRRYTKTAQPK